MATMSLTTEAGKVIARSTSGKGLLVELQGGATATSMTKVIDETSTTPVVQLEAGKCYTFEQPLSSLEIESVDAIPYESAVVFVAGSSFSLSMPDTIRVVGTAPEFHTNWSYIISFRDDMAVFGEIAP